MTVDARFPVGTLVTADFGPRVYEVVSTRRSALAGWQHELRPLKGGINIYRFGNVLVQVGAPARPPVTEAMARSPARLGIIIGGRS